MSHLSRPEPHRLDELSAGYSSAGCSPAVPASAFPAVEVGNRAARKSTIFQSTVTVSLCRCLSLGVHTLVLLAVAKLLVPVADNPDGRWRTGLHPLHHHDALAVGGDIVGAKARPIAKRYVRKQRFRVAR